MPLKPPGPRLTPWLLFAGGVLISAFTIRRGIDPFDEGISLAAARRVASGEVPYGDFTWAYGPAWPYLLAGLSKLFGGASLLQWRVLRALADAGVALVVWVLLRRYEAPPRVALLGWLAAACAMAEPRSANPFPFALLFALLAIANVRRPIIAGLLIALAAAFRLDFALYGAAAVTVALLADREWKPTIRFWVVTAAVSLLIYAPFLVQIGPSKLYTALVGTSLHDRNYWTLSFPLSYGGSISPRPHALKDILDYYQPLLLVVGLAIATFMRRAGLALLVFGLGALSYLLSRTDEFHTQPLFVVLAVLLPALAVRSWGRQRAIAVAAAVVFALILAEGVANRLSALFRPPAMSEVHVAAADGVEAPPREARAIERVVADVDRLAPGRGDAIYVAPRRSDLVTYSNSILYVLADRDNAAGRDFGLVASAAEQTAIVDRLRARRPRVIVRWTDPLSSKREPNLRGRPSGSHVLDQYLASDYRLLERLYHYDVLVPR